MQRYDRGLKFGWLWVLAYSIFANLGSLTQAQVVPDATLGAGKNSITNTQGSRTDITGGLRRNSALFHSFDRFSIDTNRQVYFANPTGIRNIFSRVTGGSASNIDGLLGVSGSANLFLMNPNGIIFGPNARLDVSGSFLATTATALEFADGQRFAANGDRAVPLVEVNIPIGLQIAANAPAMLNNQGNLAVNPGQSLTLAGGNTTHTGTLTAPGGTVLVLGNQVALTDQAQVDVSSPTGGGTVLIGGDYQGRGSLLNSTQTVVGSGVSINANATGQGNGGRVIVWSDGNTQFGGNISAQGGPQGGNGGFVETSGRQTLSVLPSATVSTRTSQGTLGTWLLDPVNLTVQAGGTAALTGGPPLTNTPVPTATISAATIVAGLDGNNVDLQATNSITVNEAIDASGNGNAGNLALSAPNTILNQPITLRTGSTLSGTATTVAVNTGAKVQNGVDVAATTGATVTVATGSYPEAVAIDKPLNLNFAGAGATLTSLQTTTAANPVGLIGTLTTTGDQTYDGSVTLSGATVTLTGANIAFNNTLGGISSLNATATGGGNLTFNTVGTLTTPLGNLTTNTTGITSFGSVRAASVTTDAGGSTRLSSDITATTQTYNDDVSLTGNTALTGTSLVLNPFIITGNNNDLSLNFGNPVIVVSNSQFSGLRNFANNGTGVTQIVGDFTTTGTQTYSNAVALSADATLTGTTVDFGSTVGGSQVLVVKGNATFGDAVGTVLFPLQSLVVEQNSNFNGGSIRTVADQTYRGIVTLGAMSNLSGANLTFNSTVSGNQTLTAIGSVTFDQTVDVGSLIVLGASQIGQNVRTSGVQSYTGAVTVTGSNTTLAASTLTLNLISPVTIAANNSNTTLAIDTLNLGINAVSASGTGTHSLTLQPQTSTRDIALNNSLLPSSALNLSETQLNSSFVNFGQVTIGQAGGTGTTTISSALTLTQPYLTFRGGNLVFADSLTLAPNTSLNIQNSQVTDNIFSNTPAITASGTGTIAFNLTGNVGTPALDPTAALNSPASFGPLKMEGTIGTSTVDGELHLRSRQIRQSGAIAVSGTASFRSTQADAGRVDFRSDTDTLVLGEFSRIGGDLNITLNPIDPTNPTAIREISQVSGSTLQVVGALNVLPLNIIQRLNEPSNILPDFQVRVMGNDVEVVGTGNIDLTNALNRTTTPSIPVNINNLTVVANARSQIFVSSPLNNATGIALTETGNRFNGSLTLNTASPSPSATGTTAASITQSGTGVAATGIVKLTAATNTGQIRLPNSDNAFGSLQLISGGATIQQAGNMDVTSATIANNLTLDSSGRLNLNNTRVGGNLVSTALSDMTLNNVTLTGTTIGTGDLKVTAGGSISQAGIVDQASTTAIAVLTSTGTDSTIALNNPNNQIRGKIGFTTPNGADASLTNGSDIKLGISNLGSGSNLTLTNVSDRIDLTSATLTTAPDATIRIQSIDPNRDISLNTSVPGQLSVNVTQLSNALSNRSTEIIIGQDTATGNVTIGSAPNSVAVQNSLTVHGGSIVSNSPITTAGGNLNLLANTGQVSTQGINTISSIGNGGNIQLQGETITVLGNLDPTALGSGKTGNITLTATDGDVKLTNGTLKFDVFGTSGDVVIQAFDRQIILDNYGIVGTVAASAVNPGGTATLSANTITLKSDSRLQVGSESTSAAGTGGNIQVNANNRLLLNQATIVNNTSGPGNGGNISLQGGNNLSLENNTQINTNTSGKGNGGGVLVQGNTVSLTDNAQINATNSGSGRGSSVLVQGNDRLDANSAQITTTTSGSGAGSSVDLRGNTVTLTGSTTTLKTAVTPGATGVGGTVTVQGNTVTLAQGATVEASTQSTANTAKGGTIAFNAAGDLLLQEATVTNTTTGSGTGGTIGMVGNALTVTNQTQISADTSGTATGGTIFLVANALTLSDQTQITALTSGGGSGGGIRLEGNTIANISGNNTVLKTDARGSGIGSSISVAGQTIALTDRARVESNVSSSGNGGVVQLGNASTNSLTLTDSTIATTVAAGATGKGSPVTLQGSTLSLNKAQVDANVVPGSGGRGSDIDLVGGTVRLQGQSQISTRTAADNTRAGNITIAAQTSFNLVEQSQLLTTASAPGAIGGNIDFKGSQFNIDTAQVIASSALGPAGNITFTAQSLTLRQGRLIAENGQSTRNRGGNITLRVFGRMTLSDESLISTSGQNGADSGNIFISSVSFAFAEVPTGPNGSDIIGRSVGGGKGGNVVFEPKLVRGFKVQPALPGNRTNDIDSNGEVNASGSSLSAVQVQIKPLEPQAASTAPQGCSIGSNSAQKESRFTVGGRGGVQLSPTALLPAEAVSSDWVSLDAAPIATATPFPDGNLATLQLGQTYQIQTVCVNSWKNQQRSSL